MAFFQLLVTKRHIYDTLQVDVPSLEAHMEKIYYVRSEEGNESAPGILARRLGESVFKTWKTENGIVADFVWVTDRPVVDKLLSDYLTLNISLTDLPFEIFMLSSSDGDIWINATPMLVNPIFEKRCGAA